MTIDMKKLEDGELIRILPIVKKDGTTVPYVSTSYIYEGGKMIYDRHGLIDRLWAKERGREGGATSGIGRRYWIFVESGGECRFVYVGASVMKAAKGLFDEPFSDKALRIVKKDMVVGGSSFPAYTDSVIEVAEWAGCPAEEDRIGWLKERQKISIFDWIDERGPLRNLEALRERFGESIAAIMAEDRNKKLEDLGL